MLAEVGVAKSMELLISQKSQIVEQLWKVKEYKDALAKKHKESVQLQQPLKEFLDKSKLMRDKIKRLLDENEVLRSRLETSRVQMRWSINQWIKLEV